MSVTHTQPVAPPVTHSETNRRVASHTRTDRPLTHHGSSAAEAISVVQTASAVAESHWETAMLRFQLSGTAALVELITDVHQSRRRGEAWRISAMRLQQTLRVDRVVLCRVVGGSARVIAISDVPDPASQSAAADGWMALADEAVAAGDTIVGHRADPRWVRHDAYHGGVISIPLHRTDRHGVRRVFATISLMNPGGAIDPRDSAGLENFLSAAADPLAAALDAADHRRRSWRPPLKRSFGLIVATVALIGALFIRVPYRIAGDVVVQPAKRQFCVVPHEGVLDETIVKPGDRVTAGQTLALMNTDELKLQRASLKAEYLQSSRQRDAHRSMHETTDAEVQSLEMQRIACELNLIDNKIAASVIQTPVSGLVIDGELDNRTGESVRRGERLFEIASTRENRVRIYIPAELIDHVDVGSPVTIRYDGMSGSSIDAAITRIAPRSTIVDGRSVYVGMCQMDSDNASTDAVRPGMRGHARVDTGLRSIGYIIGHRWFETLRRSWPWG